MARSQTTKRITSDHRPPTYIAWRVEDKGEKSFWTRIGAAWDHKDGKGLTLQLDLLPVSDGRIILRTPSEGKNQEAGA